MIILDTNVVSELMKGPGAEPKVVAFVSGLTVPPVTMVFTRMEVLVGILALPEGKRRRDLFAAVERILSGTRLLEFDNDAADACAAAFTRRARAGAPMSMVDAMIAGIALTHDATLVTRNTRDFEGLGLRMINPWETT